MSSQTPNMPRTQATICGAPKAMAMPRIAPIHQPQDTRFAMAIAPSTITRMIAIGVSQARMLLWSAVAPVMKGELCAITRTGTAHSAVPIPTPFAPARCGARLVCMLDLRSSGVSHAMRAGGDEGRRLRFAPCVALFPLDLAGGAEAEAVDNERVIVLLLALLVGPVAGPYVRFDKQLVALACIARERLAQRAERHQPQGGHHLAGCARLVLTRVIVAHQAEARVAGVVLGNQLRVASEIIDRGQREAVHRECSSMLVWRAGVEAQSI